MSFNALPVQHHKIPNIKILPLTKFSSFSIPHHTPFLISAPEYVFLWNFLLSYIVRITIKKLLLSSSNNMNVEWMKIVFFFLKVHKFYACFMLFWKNVLSWYDDAIAMHMIKFKWAIKISLRWKLQECFKVRAFFSSTNEDSFYGV